MVHSLEFRWRLVRASAGTHGNLSDMFRSSSHSLQANAKTVVPWSGNNRFLPNNCLFVSTNTIRRYTLCYWQRRSITHTNGRWSKSKSHHFKRTAGRKRQNYKRCMITETGSWECAWDWTGSRFYPVTGFGDKECWILRYKYHLLKEQNETLHAAGSCWKGEDYSLCIPQRHREWRHGSIYS